MNEFYEKTFEYLVYCMLQAGGDGDSALYCDKWKQAADYFEIWLKEKQPEFPMTRRDDENCIIFYDNQESVGFYPHTAELPPHGFCEGVVRTFFI